MTTQFRVKDASCGHCKQTIESAVSQVEGVGQVALDLESKVLKIEHEAAVPPGEFVDAIAGAGYTPEELR